MSAIENCDSGSKQNVGPDDISDEMGGGKKDNDRYCKIAGLNVILVRENGEYFCVLPGGVHCGKWNEDPADQARFDKYI